jgi:hypothetical protein
MKLTGEGEGRLAGHSEACCLWQVIMIKKPSSRRAFQKVKVFREAEAAGLRASGVCETASAFVVWMQGFVV